MVEATLLLEDPFFVFWFLWFFWFGALPPEDLGFFHFHRTLAFPLPEDHVFLRCFSFSSLFLCLFWLGGPGKGGVIYIYIYICISISESAYARIYNQALRERICTVTVACAACEARG